MIRVCSSKFHKGSRVFGEKPPYSDKSETHGYCEECFILEMEELERQGHIKSDWRERLTKFKKNPRRRTNMPRERQPKKGDFVLYDDEVWIIGTIGKKKVYLVGVRGEEEVEEFLIDNLAPTDIKTWEVE